MEHCIRIAFWIVTLSGSLQANRLPADSWRHKLMLKDIICEPESTFYSPENVKEQCISAALVCAKRELIGTVRTECTDPNKRIEQGRKALDYRISEWKQKTTGHAPTSSSECACEQWPQKSFKEFLNTIKNLTELADSILRAASA